ncbi:thioredoxin [Akkermansia sp. N21169]|uniref:thioredoxin n=1 Tax=Akkermansia sp. N21169 TaxID=3040765 RepID=UPI00244EFFDB|nr:thioredoxin [Akkermansia sp. N21169]MDH3068530.1 thioredoxin [Akkermansia sp. N21169]
MALTLTESNFQTEVLESPVPVLVDFWATWCGPCRMIGPIVEQIATEFAGKAKVGKVDVDSNNGLASAYNVRSIPTLVFIKDGQVVDTIVGATSKDAIMQKLNALI